jgi:hypothetical protein
MLFKIFFPRGCVAATRYPFTDSVSKSKTDYQGYDQLKHDAFPFLEAASIKNPLLLRGNQARSALPHRSVMYCEYR